MDNIRGTISIFRINSLIAVSVLLRFFCGVPTQPAHLFDGTKRIVDSRLPPEDLRYNFTAMRHVLIFIFVIVANLLIHAGNVSQGQVRFRYQPRPQYQRYYRPSTRPMNMRYPSGYRPRTVRRSPMSGSVPMVSATPSAPTPVSTSAPSSMPAVAPAAKSRSGGPSYIKKELPPIKEFPRIAADYEPQRAILISVCELLPTHEKVFLQILDACKGHIEVGVLVNDKKQLMDTVRLLMKQGREFPHIKFYHLDLDTIWLRDFGPRIAQLAEGSVALDFLYEGTRPRDEKMPKAWAELTGQRYHAVPWTMQGGNLLFNGKGLALTTSRIFDDNHIRFKKLLPGTDPEVERKDMVIREFRKECNLSQVVVLEPLRNEATRHVDMFAAFVADDHVLVSQLSRGGDPVNAAVLDRNAQRLQDVKLVDGRKLKVTRIPTPPREGKFWSTFTNVIFANDLILLPALSSDQNAYVERAVSIYKSLLPKHEVVVIDTSSLKKLEGSVHCMSINVPEFANLPPRYLSLKKAIAYVKNADAVALKKGKLQKAN
jgi:agmatine/peptidylarginine deiminase